MENRLLMYAEARRHRVIEAPLPETGSMSIEGNVCSIGIDTNLTHTEKLVRLAHELGHCEKAGFYYRDSPHVTREKIEHRARKWSYEAIIPPCAIRQAVSVGNLEAWDIAEFLGVPCDFLISALTYYRDYQGITF